MQPLEEYTQQVAPTIRQQINFNVRSHSRRFDKNIHADSKIPVIVKMASFEKGHDSTSLKLKGVAMDMDPKLL